MTERPTLQITQITAPSRFGGAESVVAALSLGLARRGHEIAVAALFGADPEERCIAYEPLEAGGVQVHEIRLPARSYRAERDQLERLLAQSGRVVAHCHGYHADLVGLSAARATGRPVVSTVHGFTGGSWRNRLYEWLDCRALRRFDAVVPVSEPLVGRLTSAGLAPDRISLIPNGYAASGDLADRATARASLGLPLDLPVIGWVGRLTGEKGPEQFLECLGRVSRPFVASVVGDGALRPALEQRAQGLGIADRIRWHGPVPNAGRLLRAFDVLVLSSRTEGTPIVLLEAMAAEVPIVATAVGGVPDLLTDAGAHLIPDGHPDLLANAIDQVLSDPSSARTQTKWAKNRVETLYGIDPWLDRYEELYRGVGGR